MKPCGGFCAGKENSPDKYTAQDYGPLETINETFIMLKLPFTSTYYVIGMMMLSYVIFLVQMGLRGTSGHLEGLLLSLRN